MALQTDDLDIRDVRFFMQSGGNGDYYLNLMDMNKKVRIDCRIATSGSKAPTEVIIAVANLYRAMEAAKLNEHPANEK